MSYILAAIGLYLIKINTTLNISAWLTLFSGILGSLISGFLEVLVKRPTR